MNQHGIPDADILFLNFIFIVQGGTTDHRTPYFYRRQMSDRRQHAGAAYLHFDIFQQCGFLQGFEFIGQRPSRASGGRPQYLLQAEAIHFNHHTIDVIGELMALFTKLPVKLQNLLNIYPGPDQWINFKPPVFQ